MPLKLEAYKQPWSISEEGRKPVAKLELRFHFFSKVKIENAHLVMEEPESSSIMLNGQAVTTTPGGWCVDKAIRRLRLPECSLKKLVKGENSLLIKVAFRLLTNVERVYIQGSFWVRLRGQQAILVSHRPDELSFGDWTRQGLPFNAGDITYHCSITAPSPAQPVALCIPRFSAPVLAVAVDGTRQGLIAFEPYILELRTLEPGHHTLEITCFGNRFNAFGHLHLPEGVNPWCGPLLWWTEDDW
jgi:hypothetical protein